MTEEIEMPGQIESLQKKRGGRAAPSLPCPSAAAGLESARPGKSVLRLVVCELATVAALVDVQLGVPAVIQGDKALLRTVLRSVLVLLSASGSGEEEKQKNS